MLNNSKNTNFIHSIFESLEERVLFDGVPDATFVLPQADAVTPIPEQVQSLEQIDSQAPRELILIDAGVENSEALLAEILESKPNSALEIRMIDSNSDGIEQISAILAESDSKYDAIHIISHGNEGEVVLGNTSLNADNLNQYADELAGWADALGEDADLLFYGCDLAGNEAGEDFVQTISDITGADVAASDDVTGAVDQGGDWDLELRVGTVEAVSITAENWDGTLLGDADGDGLDHIDDLDDDNDGILDVDEGFSVTTETIDLSGYQAGELVQTFSVTPELDARITFTSTNGTFFDVGGVTPPFFDAAADGFAGGVDDIGIAFDPPNGDPSTVVATIEFFEAGTTNAVVVNAVSTEISDIDSSNPSDPDVGRRDRVTVESFQGGTAQNVTLGLVDAANATLAISGNVATGLDDDTAISDNDATGSITVDTGPVDTLVITYDEITGSADPAARGIGVLANFTVDVPVTRDTDGDGIADHKDLDSDNDGISDLVESGADASVVDTNGDGVYDNTTGAGAQVDANGVAIAANGGVLPVDTDNDGVNDFLDLDSDNDGIADTIEAFPTAGYTTNDGDVSNEDSDGDGIIDAFDTTLGHGGDFTTPEDTDSDGTADFLDTDSDGDLITDTAESGLTLDGEDLNGDGIDDAVNASYADPNGDIDVPISDLANVDTDATDADYRSLNDKDGDGVADINDLDDDNDGITDVEEGQIAELVTFSNALDGTTPVNDVIVDTIFFDDVGNVDEQRFDNDNFTFATGATAIPGKNFNFNEDELAVLDAGGQYDLTFDYSGQALVTEVFLHLNSLDSIRLELLAAENPNIGFEVLSGSNFNQTRYKRRSQLW